MRSTVEGYAQEHRTKGAVRDHPKRAQASPRDEPAGSHSMAGPSPAPKRSQVPAAASVWPYVLDFFCGDARLAVEVDGEAHSRGDRPTRDEVRDRWLGAAGIATLRVAAVDVLKDADAVVRWIVAQASARLPRHQPARPDGPPPPD